MILTFSVVYNVPADACDDTFAVRKGFHSSNESHDQRDNSGLSMEHMRLWKSMPRISTPWKSILSDA
jgi:hypothetical protein